MATTRLALYNNALIFLGERQLADEYENRPARKVLDEVYALNLIGHCLEMAKPKFASVTAKLDTPAASAATGFDYVYTLPSDFLCLGAVYTDENLQNKVERYLYEGRTIATEIPTNLYVRYISSNVDFNKWTPSFSQLVSAYLAVKSATRIAPDKLASVDKEFKDMLSSVLESESIQEPASRPVKAIRTLDAFGIRLYNGALQLLGKPLIVDNTDQSAARIALDYAVGVSKEGIYFCFEKIKPLFAMKTAALTGGSASAVHAYTKVYTLASDYLCLVGLYADNQLDEPVNRYLIDGTSLNCNYDPVYIRYIQNAPTDASWSPGFFRYVCAHLAFEVMAEHAAGETATERDTRRATIARTLQDLTQYVTSNEAWKEPQVRATNAAFVLTSAWRTVYNHALMLLKLPPILANTDDSQRRYALDQAVNDNVVGTTLEIIPWAFGTTRAKLTYTVADSIDWGYTYRFDVPTDFHRMDIVSGDEYFVANADYRREGSYIYSDYQILYIRYVTTAMLTTPASWPLYFRNLVAAKMAEMAKWLPGADSSELKDTTRDYESEAMSTDASRNPPKPIREGTWIRARGRHDRGSIENGHFRRG